MKAISSMATRRLLHDLTAEAASAGLPSLRVESIGGVDAARRIARREHFDLAFLSQAALTTLAQEGHLLASSITPLVRSQVGVAIRAVDAEPALPKMTPAFQDASELRDALRSGGRIGYSTGPSGTALVKAIDEWGLTAAVSHRLVQASPGIPVTRLLADGEVDLGFQQISELVGAPGIEILGVLPADCAIDTVFAGAVTATSSRTTDGSRLLRFMASASTVAIRTAHAFSVP